jgi:hypothetical protein
MVLINVYKDFLKYFWGHIPEEYHLLGYNAV